MRRHPFRAVSFVFGLLFAVTGLAFLGNVDIWRMDWSWIWPAILIGTGLLVLLSARADAAAPDRDQPPPAYDPDADLGADDPLDARPG